MRKGAALLSILWVLLGPIAITQAQQARVYRVGIIVGGSLVPTQVKGLRDGLVALGYIEGKNIILDLIHGENADELRASIHAYIRKRIDVIVTTAESETTIAKEATEKIPIIFLPVRDPVKAGFVKSLASPGTTLTGLTFYTDLKNYGKQLEIFKEIVPSYGESSYCTMLERKRRQAFRASRWSRKWLRPWGSR